MLRLLAPRDNSVVYYQITRSVTPYKISLHGNCCIIKIACHFGEVPHVYLACVATYKPGCVLTKKKTEVSSWNMHVLLGHMWIPKAAYCRGQLPRSSHSWKVVMGLCSQNVKFTHFHDQGLPLAIPMWLQHCGASVSKQCRWFIIFMQLASWCKLAGSSCEWISKPSTRCILLVGTTWTCTSLHIRRGSDTWKMATCF